MLLKKWVAHTMVAQNYFAPGTFFGPKDYMMKNMLLKPVATIMIELPIG